jgi:hypothetical protein
MLINIRMHRSLYDDALADLRRPHAHAAERVGFLFGRLVSAEYPVILMARFWTVPDDLYVRDYSVGARISGDAIRMAMQIGLDSGDGIFHTHLHEWRGRPAFSAVDQCDMPKFIPAFQTVVRKQATGLFLFSADSAIADVWLPDKKAPEQAAKISVVGSPLQFIGGQS